MSIVGSVNGSGTKASTAGTTFTITFSAGSGASIYVGVAIPGGSVTVSTITDGGNIYHPVSQALLADLDLELWKSDRVTAGGLSTITITLSATGTLAAGVARSFTGVAFAEGVGENVGSANGTVSPASTGNVTTVDNVAGNTSCLISIFGLNVNETMTVTGSGTIRSQTGVVGAAVAFCDQLRATPISQSVTFTDTEWAVVWEELRSLSATYESNAANWADGVTKNLSADLVTQSFGYQLVIG